MKDDDSQALEKNLWLIFSYCASFISQIKGGAIEPEDLLQEGAIGYWQGTAKFSPDRGIKFSTYIRQRVRRHARTFLYCHNHAVTISPAMINNIYEFLRARKDLQKAIGREPTNEEVWGKLTWLAERFRKTIAAMEIIFQSRCIPLNGKIDQDDQKSRKFDEVITIPDDLTAEKKITTKELAVALKNILGDLPLNKRKCLMESIILEKNRQEIAENMDLTPERVRQLINKAIFEIRNSPKLKQLAEFNGQAECFGILLNIRGEAILSQGVKNQIRGILLSDDSWPELYGHKNDHGKFRCLELYFGFEDRFYSLEEVGKKLYKQRQKLNALELLQDALDKLPPPLKEKIVAAIKNGNGQ